MLLCPGLMAIEGQHYAQAWTEAVSTCAGATDRRITPIHWRLRQYKIFGIVNLPYTSRHVIYQLGRSSTRDNLCSKIWSDVELSFALRFGQLFDPVLQFVGESSWVDPFHILFCRDPSKDKLASEGTRVSQARDGRKHTYMFNSNLSTRAL